MLKGTLALVLLVSVLFGCALSRVGPRGAPLLEKPVRPEDLAAMLQQLLA